MKIKLNKWLRLMVSFVILITGLNACVKDRNILGTDFSQLQDHVVLANAGLSNFSGSNVRFNTDTATFTITANLASVNLPTSPVSVTIGVDTNLINIYNGANGTDFKPFPTDAYKIMTTTLTIPSGQQYAETTIEIYKEKVDPVESYLLPVSILDASGKELSVNQNTLYFNIIGNVIAGNYNWDFTRYNTPTPTPPVSGLSFTGDVATFIADNASQVEVESGYFIQPRYVISFTNNNGALSNFQVSMNPDDVAALTAAGVTITDGPNIIKADPVAGEYIFQYTTTSRYIIDRYYK